ncbi:MAG: DUF3842 family protein [Candidatus Ornithospirochaeta sp.]|nr:DUF3842 family protein [Candidatus Ornithospirochaeta sp.]
MVILVIDGQGGGLGKQVISSLKARFPEDEVIAVGTNSTATLAMLKAGADRSATGENPVIVASRRADVIIGPVGIVIADSMMGEITADMAVAVARSDAERILIPVNLCNNQVVGVPDLSLSVMIDGVISAVARIKGRSLRTR